ncbi:NAD-P-binding protein [Trametes polyzona]|nr:NAD-P-binding protein [Trametes polyzona]
MVPWSVRREYWSVDDVPDQSGKVFLITGGNTGIGFAIAKTLLRRNAKVYITSRDRERGRDALDQLRRIPEAIEVLPLDLSDLRSIQRAAHEFMRREKYLHVLMNNAAVMCPPVALLTKQRYDLQFGVNTLGHFYLTRLLLPVLLATSKTTAQSNSIRVVHYTCALPATSHIDYTTLMDGPVRRRCSPAALYRQSKLGNLLFAKELADQYAEQGIASLAIDSGNVSTELGRHLQGFSAVTRSLFSQDVSKGVVLPLFAATAPRAGHMNGKLLSSRGRAEDVPPTLLARGAGEALWDWLSAQTECFESAFVTEAGKEGADDDKPLTARGWRVFDD